MKFALKLSLSTLRRVFIFLAIVLLSGGSGYLLGQQNFTLGRSPLVINRSVPPSANVDFSLFWRVWDDLHHFYVDRQNLDSNKLIYGAISGMVSAAGDPYTLFLTPDQNKETQQDLSGSFGGVGIELGFKNNTLAVIAALPGTPAQKAGVKAGDLILKITDPLQKVDQATDNITLPQAVTLIRGPKGSALDLTLARTGIDKPFTVHIVRDTIIVKTVNLTVKNSQCQSGQTTIDCSVPVLQVTRFGESTDREWDAAVAQVLALKQPNKNVPGLILDLRDDPGGFLDQAVNLASDFIPSGPVVWQQTATGDKVSYSVTRSARLSGFRLVVLINQGSASAAEILAGALSEHAHAVLVGEKSFGKGSVQQPEDLPGGAGLHVTIAKWLLPSQKSIDKVGITPDITVANDSTDNQLNKALELLSKP